MRIIEQTCHSKDDNNDGTPSKPQKGLQSAGKRASEAERIISRHYVQVKMGEQEGEGGNFGLWGKLTVVFSQSLFSFLNECLSSDFLKHTRASLICWLRLWLAEVALFSATSRFPWDGL